jgi:hypothetical protein
MNLSYRFCLGKTSDKRLGFSVTHQKKVWGSSAGIKPLVYTFLLGNHDLLIPTLSSTQQNQRYDVYK